MFALKQVVRSRALTNQSARCLQCAVAKRSASQLGAPFSANDARGGEKQGGPTRSAQASLFALSASAAFLWSAIISAHAEEPEGPIFSKDEVEVICVIGPPLCGKATQTARIANRFDALALGPEDDFYAEFTQQKIPNRKDRLRVVINGFPKTLNEAAWFEEEICPIAAIIYVDLPPEVAIKRTNERAYSAVKGGHRLFRKETGTLIEQFRDRGNILEIDGGQSLEGTWKQIEAKLDQALQLNARGQLI